MLKYGADPTKKNKAGISALELAGTVAKMGSKEWKIYSALYEMAVSKGLIADSPVAKLDPWTGDDDSDSPDRIK